MEEPKRSLLNRNLLLRILGGLLYAGCWLGVVYWGGLAFALFTFIAIIIMAVEFVFLASNRSIHLGKLILPLCAVSYAVVVWVSRGVTLPFHCGFDRMERVFALGAGIVILYSARSIMRVKQGKALEEWVMGVAGSAYIGLLAAHLLLLRFRDGGQGYILMLLGALWMTDTLAYLVGVSCGRHRLAPDISPKKSVEGTLAGMAGGIAGAVLVWYAMQQAWLGLDVVYHWPVALWVPVFLGLGISIVGQIGDLAESLVKRWAGVKDAGGLIPGHGGLLDRMDSVLFAGPFMYYCIRFMEGAS